MGQMENGPSIRQQNFKATEATTSLCSVETVDPPSFWMILWICSTASVLSARLYGGPILCGNTIAVSTTRECSSLTARRSDSRLWPTRMSRAATWNSSCACTSRSVVRTPARSVSLMPLNLHTGKYFYGLLEHRVRQRQFCITMAGVICGNIMSRNVKEKWWSV